MKHTYPAFALLLLAISCGSGSREPEPRSAAPAPPDTLVIAAIDTLGAEMGVSPDVFAFIAGAAFTPEGGIAVLDAGRICLQVFQPDGEGAFPVGRKGSGPGEYQMPLGLAITDYGFVVSDLAGGKIIRYDGSGNLIDEITGFFPVPPVRITGAGSRFLATDIFMDVNGGEPPSVSMDFVAFSDSSEPETTFESFPMETTGGMVNSDAAPSFAFAAGPQGEAYLSLISDSLFLVTGYDPQGGETFRIEEEWERIPLTQQEMAEEELAVSLTIENGETTLGTSRQRRTDTHRDIATGIGVDRDGLIWVQMGHTGETCFRVYSPSGELLHIAVPDGSVDQDARYSITPLGMLAYDSDPADWPKVYILQVR